MWARLNNLALCSNIYIYGEEIIASISEEEEEGCDKERGTEGMFFR